MTVTIPNLPSTAVLSLKPFKINISDEEVSRFQQLLKLTPEHTTTFENSQAEWHGKQDGKRYFGLTGNWMRQARKQWETLDWRAKEKELNEYPQYKVTLSQPSGNSFDIHFIASLSSSPDAIPLLLLHGWPGSFVEFLPLLPLLQASTDSNPKFSIIIPSLPGYGFSSKPPVDNDFGVRDVAGLFDQLMVGLGFGVNNEGRGGYCVQGGDIGGVIARLMVANFHSCLGGHFNMMMLHQGPMGLMATPGWEKELDGDDMKMLGKGKEFFETGMAYAKEHENRPSTIGMVIESSPVALLGWIGEIFVGLSDPTGPPLPLDKILTIASLWWYTNSFPTSIYPYREIFNPDAGEVLAPLIKNKPFGYSTFKHDGFPIPQAWIAKQGDNMVLYRYHEKGGHFGSLEMPEALAGDLIETMKALTKHV